MRRDSRCNALGRPTMAGVAPQRRTNASHPTSMDPPGASVEGGLVWPGRCIEGRGRVGSHRELIPNGHGSLHDQTGHVHAALATLVGAPGRSCPGGLHATGPGPPPSPGCHPHRHTRLGAEDCQGSVGPHGARGDGPTGHGPAAALPLHGGCRPGRCTDAGKVALPPPQRSQAGSSCPQAATSRDGSIAGPAKGSCGMLATSSQSASASDSSPKLRAAAEPAAHALRSLPAACDAGRTARPSRVECK